MCPHSFFSFPHLDSSRKRCRNEGIGGNMNLSNAWHPCSVTSLWRDVNYLWHVAQLNHLSHGFWWILLHLEVVSRFMSHNIADVQIGCEIMCLGFFVLFFTVIDEWIGGADHTTITAITKHFPHFRRMRVFFVCVFRTLTGLPNHNLAHANA